MNDSNTKAIYDEIEISYGAKDDERLAKAGWTFLGVGHDCLGCEIHIFGRSN
jgi:hypothetical protein